LMIGTDKETSSKSTNAARVSRAVTSSGSGIMVSVVKEKKRLLLVLLLSATAGSAGERREGSSVVWILCFYSSPF
jgi:hypothetical protein